MEALYCETCYDDAPTRFCVCCEAPTCEEHWHDHVLTHAADVPAPSRSTWYDDIAGDKFPHWRDSRVCEVSSRREGSGSDDCGYGNIDYDGLFFGAFARGTAALVKRQ